jgi:hypothetical protein
MADPADNLAGPDPLAGGDRHGSRDQVGEHRAGIGPLQDHMVPGDRVDSAGRIEPDRGRQGVGQLAHHVDSRALGHPVHGRDDDTVEGCVDGLAPPVVVASALTEQRASQGAARVKAQAPAVVGPDEVEGVALSEHVGAVAGNPVCGRPHGDPLASQREFDDHSVGCRSHRYL